MKTLKEHIGEKGLKPKWWNVREDILELPVPLLGLILTGGGDVELKDFMDFLGKPGIKSRLEDKITFKVKRGDHVSIHRIDGSHTRRDCFVLYSSGYIYSGEAEEYNKAYGRRG